MPIRSARDDCECPHPFPARGWPPPPYPGRCRAGCDPAGYRAGRLWQQQRSHRCLGAGHPGSEPRLKLGRGRWGAGIPGASGLIAAVSPGTLQVQSATAQNTVVYTATTKFTTITAGHLAAGDCVTVTGTPGVGSAKALTATSVRIDAKVNDACPATGGGAGAGGGGFGGAGSYSSRPSGAPSRAPSGGGSAARRAFASATGTVSSVSGSTILVSGVLRGRAGATSSATAPTASTITVTLAASATVTQTVAATSAAAVLGKCATAIGPANSAGAITAKSITISTPGPTGCSAGFGGFGGRGGGSGGAGGTGSSSAAGTGSNA